MRRRRSSSTLAVTASQDFRFGFHHIQKTAEAGETLLDHFYQFHQNLDRADKNTDIEGIHGKIANLHLSFGNEVAAED